MLEETRICCPFCGETIKMFFERGFHVELGKQGFRHKETRYYIDDSLLCKCNKKGREIYKELILKRIFERGELSFLQSGDLE